MTQEELDALLNDEASEQQTQEDTQLDAEELVGGDNQGDEQENEAPSDFRIESETLWPPPPPNAEHKVIHQLDDVTRDSEMTATQTFDKLEVISNAGEAIAQSISELEKFLNSQEEMLQKLHAKFPDFHTFSQKLEEIEHIKKDVLKTIANSTQHISDAALEAMNIMQYQDIHRQKIERVINVMRSLARYMSSLFESKIDDSKRVSSAVHIEGDNTENVLSEEDIEKLVSSLSNNQ